MQMWIFLLVHLRQRPGLDKVVSEGGSAVLALAAMPGWDVSLCFSSRMLSGSSAEAPRT